MAAATWLLCRLGTVYVHNSSELDLQKERVFEILCSWAYMVEAVEAVAMTEPYTLRLACLAGTFSCSLKRTAIAKHHIRSATLARDALEALQEHKIRPSLADRASIRLCKVIKVPNHGQNSYGPQKLGRGGGGGKQTTIHTLCSGVFGQG